MSDDPGAVFPGGGCGCIFGFLLGALLTYWPRVVGAAVVLAGVTWLIVRCW